MHIAHFIQRYPPALGGSEAYFARLSRYLAARGHSVTVWTTTAIDLEAFWTRHRRELTPSETIEDNVAIRRYAPWRWPLRRYILKAVSVIPARSWQAMTMPCNPCAWSMWRTAGTDTAPCDVVHASAFPYAWPIVCARRLARRRGVPFFVTPFLHLGDPDNPRDPTRLAYTRAPLAALLRSADHIFAQTPSEKRLIESLGIPNSRVAIQGMGVAPDECTGGDRHATRKSWGVAEHEIVVGHLANLSAEKGSIDLLQAAELAWRRGARFRLALAGPEMTNFRRFWDQFPMQDSVIRLGVLSDSQKRDFFAGIDVFALPSRSDSFGLVLLEAWANGVANIGYRAGGIADVILHESDGLLVRCGDVEGLASAIMRMTDNPTMMRAFGSAGQERIAAEFRWADKLALVEEAYRAAVK